jgi:hypothetical protein
MALWRKVHHLFIIILAFLSMVDTFVILMFWYWWVLYGPGETLVGYFDVMMDCFMGLSWTVYLKVIDTMMFGRYLSLLFWHFSLVVVTWLSMCWCCSFVFALPWAGPVRFIALNLLWFINGYTNQTQ